jgi:hypothetical protein
VEKIMNAKTKRIAVATIVSLQILLSVLGIPFGQQMDSRVLANSKSQQRARFRISDELSEKVKRNSNSLIPVVMQLSPAPEDSSFNDLLKEIKRAGVQITRRYKKMNVVAALIEPNAIARISNLPGVEYVSVDRPTASAGHLEEVMVRAEQANSMAMELASPS